MSSSPPLAEGLRRHSAKIHDTLIVLYARGTLAAGVVRVAVVGSHTPNVAFELAGRLAARGVEIVGSPESDSPR